MHLALCLHAHHILAPIAIQNQLIRTGVQPLVALENDDAKDIYLSARLPISDSIHVRRDLEVR